jgi:RES domain-containing protein
MTAVSDLVAPAKPFAGTAYFATVEPVLDVEDTVTTQGNRWSQAGEPTVYLAGDPSVALAELARHSAPDEAPDGVIWSVAVRLDAPVDLRDPAIRRAYADDGAAKWLDHDWCRSLAGELRATGAHDGLIVPSAAMLDRPERLNVVVFVERLRRPLEDALTIQGTLAAIRPKRQEAGAPG